MHLQEKKLNGSILYDGKIIRVEKDAVLLENNRQALREVVRHPGGVCIAALDQKNQLYFVRQFRYPYRKTLLELPAGKLDRTSESPLLAGKRELLEETGLLAKRYYSLGTLYPSPGYCDEILHLFAAFDLEKSTQQLDQDEFLDVVKIPFQKAVESALDGELQDAKTVAAILKLQILLSRPHQLKQVNA